MNLIKSNWVVKQLALQAWRPEFKPPARPQACAHTHPHPHTFLKPGIAVCACHAIIIGGRQQASKSKRWASVRNPVMHYVKSEDSSVSGKWAHQRHFISVITDTVFTVAKIQSQPICHQHMNEKKMWYTYKIEKPYSAIKKNVRVTSTGRRIRKVAKKSPLKQSKNVNDRDKTFSQK